MSLRILDAKAVRALLPIEKCIDLMREAFLAQANGRALQPIRTAMRHRDGVLSMMPGAISPDLLGIKVMTVFPGNFGNGLPSHQGMVLLFNAETGAPLAILDAREITAIRTSAASAVATDILATKEAKSIAVFGYGEQAHAHVAAIRKVRPIESVMVWGRDRRKAHAFTEGLSGVHASAVASPEEACGAEILCFTTAAQEPYFAGRWLRPGQHLNVVGSSVPTTAEIDSATLAASRVFVDFKESALALGGDLRRAVAEGAISEDGVLGSIGEILAGLVAGRREANDITLFKSLGMIAEDLFAASHILRMAETRAVGAVVAY